MWFKITDYPKFWEEYYGSDGRWKERFERAGLKTYKFSDDKFKLLDYKCHWLDEHEYTWFVLRFS